MTARRRAPAGAPAAGSGEHRPAEVVACVLDPLAVALVVAARRVSSATIRSSAVPGSTFAPAVESRSSRGKTTRISTNCPRGTSSARRGRSRLALDVAADANRARPRPGNGCREGDGRGRLHRRRQPVERLLPFVAPDLEVDVDDVVVGDREPAQPVADRERPRRRRRRGSARRCGPGRSLCVVAEGARRTEAPELRGRARARSARSPSAT